MTYNEFLFLVIKTLPNDGETRLGQHYFNTLTETRPEIAKRIQATKLDPFYLNSVPEETEKAIRGLWEQKL
jgi:hypothetical protein